MLGDKGLVDVEGRKEGGKRNDRNRGRFAAIALPRSYRPEPPASILLVPHIHLYVHPHLLPRLLARIHRHTVWFPVRVFSTAFTAAFLSFIVPRTLFSSLAFGTPPRREVSRCNRLQSTYNTPISTPADSYTVWNTLHFRLSKYLLWCAEKP